MSWRRPSNQRTWRVQDVGIGGYMLGKKLTLPSRREILHAAGVAMAAMAVPTLGPKQARAAGYPDRPIKIIVPFAPAGPTDIMARVLGQNLAPAIGGRIITEKKQA